MTFVFATGLFECDGLIRGGLTQQHRYQQSSELHIQAGETKRKFACICPTAHECDMIATDRVAWGVEGRRQDLPHDAHAPLLSTTQLQSPSAAALKTERSGSRVQRGLLVAWSWSLPLGCQDAERLTWA